jgi:hypothetical protein
VDLEGLLEEFSEDRDGEDEDDEDLLLAMRARMRKGKAIARSEKGADNMTTTTKGRRKEWR